MNNRYKISLQELLFYMALTIYLSYQFWENTLFAINVDVSIPRLVIFFLVTFLLLLKFLVDRNHKRIFLFVIALIVFIWIGIQASNIRELVLTILFVYEARNIKFSKIIKIYFVLLTLFSTITVTASLIGVFNNNIQMEISFNRQRNYLGFLWTTYGPNIFMTIVLAWTYLNKRRKNRFVTIICFFAVNLFYYLMTDTRAIFFEMLLLFGLIILIDVNILHVSNKKVIRGMLSLCFPIMAIITMLLSLFYNRSSWGQTLNTLLSNRLNYNFLAFTRYPITLFGNVVSWNMAETVERGYFYVDSSYVQLLLQYGVIAFTIIIIYFSLIMQEYIKANNIIGVVCMFIIAIHSITDPQLFLLMYNPFILAIGQIITLRRENNNSSNQSTLYNNTKR